MDGVKIDTDAVALVVEDLKTFRQRLGPRMKDVTSKAALNIKNAARESIMAQTRHMYVKQYPNSIDYTITKSTQTMVEAEIGPNNAKPQGPLGILLEWGTPNNGGPRPHMAPALDAEAPNYEWFMGQIAADAVFLL